MAKERSENRLIDMLRTHLNGIGLTVEGGPGRAQSREAIDQALAAGRAFLDRLTREVVRPYTEVARQLEAARTEAFHKDVGGALTRKLGPEAAASVADDPDLLAAIADLVKQRREAALNGAGAGAEVRPGAGRTGTARSEGAETPGGGPEVRLPDAGAYTGIIAGTDAGANAGANTGARAGAGPDGRSSADDVGRASAAESGGAAVPPGVSLDGSSGSAVSGPGGARPGGAAGPKDAVRQAGADGGTAGQRAVPIPAAAALLPQSTQ